MSKSTVVTIHQLDDLEANNTILNWKLTNVLACAKRRKKGVRDPKDTGERTFTHGQASNIRYSGSREPVALVAPNVTVGFEICGCEMQMRGFRET